MWRITTQLRGRRHIPIWYRDPALGKNPVMWCFNPNLSDRIPMTFHFIYQRFTENDYFASGDSGAGYNNPALLYEPRPYSALPDGSEENIRHNQYYFDKFDLGMVGFIINGKYPVTERETALHGMRRFPETKRFHIFRTILTLPTRHDEILQPLKAACPDKNFELVDLYTFFRLAKYAKERGLTY